MSLINDMLNELEKNKDKNKQPETSFISQLPPADDDVISIKSKPEKTMNFTAVNLSEDKPKESNPSYRQPWETDVATPQANKTMESPSINADATIIKSNKPSQKRLLIWILIIGMTSAALAYLYLFPNSKKTEATTPMIVATPSAPPMPAPVPAPISAPTPTPVVDIQKDGAAKEAVTALNSTPADSTEAAAELTTTTQSLNAGNEKNETDSKSDDYKNQTPIDEGTIEVAPAQISPQMQAQNAYDQVMSDLGNLSSAQAIEQLQKITNEFPTLSQARLALAAMLIKYGDSDQALSVLQTGLSVTPSNNQMAELAAHVLVEKNQIKHALDILKLAQPATIQTAPDYYALMAGLYLQEKNYKQASLFYQALTNLNPQNGTWWAGLAICLEKLGQSQAAINAYDQAETVGGLSPALEAYIDQTMQGN